MLGILSAGIAPGLALLCYFYLKDQFGVEPISLVIKTFFFGCTTCFSDYVYSICVGYGEDYFLEY